MTKNDDSCWSCEGQGCPDCDYTGKDPVYKQLLECAKVAAATGGAVPAKTTAPEQGAEVIALKPKKDERGA